MQRKTYLGSRDRALDSTFSSCVHKATPAVLEASLKKQMTILANTDGIKIKPFLPGGTLDELSKFGARNTAALGFLMHKVVHDILASSDNFAHDIDAMGDMCNNFRASLYTLRAFHEVGEITELTAKFKSDTSTVFTNSGAQTTKVFSESTGYGVAFPYKTVWQLKPADSNLPTYTFIWNDHAEIPPKKHQNDPITVNVPPATEFDIGAILNLLSSSEQVSATDMGIPENGREFPRRNHRVQAIEAALGEAKQLCDWHVAFLLHYFPNSASQNTKLAIPWSLVALKRDSESLPNADDNALGTELAAVLRDHHQEESEHIMRLGPVSELLQLLVLMRTYATHFVACYEGIDHVMVRCFLEGIGAQNARMFKEHQSLDNLLMNIGKHQMTRAGIPVKAVGMRSPGCSIKFKVEMAGYFRELEGLPSVDSEHSGQLCFPDSPDDGIATEGTSTRFVVILPVESTMLVEDSGPKIRVEGFSAYDNMPVMLVIGTPEGAKTRVRAAFLFLDMLCMRQTLEVSFIPSNKAFVEATAALPKEMADFASAIREMDVTTSGFCIEIVELRPALAEAIGVKESDLIGDSKWLRQLVHIMRGGASLQSLSRVKRAAPSDYVDVKDGTPAYDLEKIRAASQELYDNMIEQGKKDHSEELPTAHESNISMHYRPLTPCYRSLASEPYDPPAGAPQPPTPQPAPGNAVPSSDTDTSVDTLLGEFAEGCKTKDDGTKFMKHMLDAMNSLPDPKVAVGIKIGLLDPVKNCLFATGKCPDGVRTVDMQPPAEQDYKARSDLDASTGSLVELLSHCTTPARTQRVVVFGVGCHYESNVLQELMSGERDPTKLYVEIAKKIQAMNA